MIGVRDGFDEVLKNTGRSIASDGCGIGTALVRLAPKSLPVSHVRNRMGRDRHDRPVESFLCGLPKQVGAAVPGPQSRQRQLPE